MNMFFCTLVWLTGRFHLMEVGGWVGGGWIESVNETFLFQSVDCPNKCIVHLFNQICLASNERCHILITNLNFEIIVAMDLSQGLQCLLSTVGLPASSLLKAVTAVKDTALKQSRWTVCNLLHKLETLFYFTIHCCEMWHESKDDGQACKDEISFLFDYTNPFPTLQGNKLSSAIIRKLLLASAYITWEPEVF